MAIAGLLFATAAAAGMLDGCGGASESVTVLQDSGVNDGAAGCPAGQVYCNGAVPLCSSLALDHANCGGCGRACGAAEACVDGVCSATCPVGQTLCGGDAGAPACVSLADDGANCGGCGRACPAGNACTKGTCTAACPLGQTLCVADAGAATCSNLGSDNDNCSTCGNVCPRGASCRSGACNCGGVLTICGDACAEVTTDANNCGRCGHGCSGGACLSGLCQPVEVASPGAQTFGLAIDATNLYVAGFNEVDLLPLAGGPLRLLAPGGCAESLAINSQFALWAVPCGSSAAFYAPLSGVGDGGAATFVPATLGRQIAVIVADATNLYWTEGAFGGIHQAPIAGGPEIVLASGSRASALAVDAARLYWGAADGRILSVPIGGAPDGGAPTVMASNENVAQMAMDTTHLYWTTIFGEIRSMPKAGGTPTTLYAEAPAFAIAVDGANVYWANKIEGGTIKMAPKAGGAVPVVLASGQHAPETIAVSPADVYWSHASSNSGSKVMRVAKP